MMDCRPHSNPVRLRLIHLIVVIIMTRTGQQVAAQDGVSPDDMRPTLNVFNSELIQPAGSTLTITCVGKQPIEWTWPDKTAVQIPSIRARAVIQRESHEEFKGIHYSSTLTVSNLTYQDTGEFGCYYQEQTPDNSASVYVYIYDGEHLFAPWGNTTSPVITLIMYSGEPAEIPCIVTHPDVNVTLWKGSTLVPESDNLVFDPQIGYSVIYPTNFYASYNFKCEARHYANKTVDAQPLTETQQVMVVYKPSTAAPHPWLESSQTTGSVLVGEVMTFTCTVQVELDTTIDMTISYPANQAGDRISQSDIVRERLTTDGYHYEKMTSTLTVSNVQKEDEGSYKCTVITHDSKSNYKEVNMLVHEKTFVTLQVIDEEVEADVGDEYVYLNVDLHAYPEPLLVWRKGAKVISDSDHHYDTKVQSHRAKLKIYDITDEDSGIYTLYGHTKDMNSSASITLHVHEPPEITLSGLDPENPSDFFMVNQYANFTCHVTKGFPAPQLTWQWQPCSHKNCDPNPGIWGMIEDSKNFPLWETKENEIKLSVPARESGFYRCLASNKLGSQEQVQKFMVSDIKDGFGQTYTGRTIIEGDILNITCYSQQQEFEVGVFYNYKHNSWEDITDTEDVKQYNDKTEHSFMTVLELRPVSLAHSGEYKCQARDADLSPHQDDFIINVKPIESPEFTVPLQGSISVELGISYSAHCEAKGVPNPQITWYYEDEELTENNDITFNENKTKMNIKSTQDSLGGTYTCEAANRGGVIASNFTLLVGLPTASPVHQAGLQGGHIALIICLIVGLLLVLLVMGFVLRRRYYSPKMMDLEDYLIPQPSYTFNPEMPMDEQTECMSYDPRWEFPKKKLKFSIMLGQGAFGKVMKATANGILECEEHTQVAVKMVRDIGSREQIMALLSELKLLIHLGQHLNIVNLLGAYTHELNRGVLYMIVEYCGHGSLRQYILKKRNFFVDTMDDDIKMTAAQKKKEAERDAVSPSDVSVDYLNGSASYTGASATAATSMATDMTGLSDVTFGPDDVTSPPDDSDYVTSDVLDSEPLTTKDLMCYSFQVARGMEYLTSRKYIHRDLAARNVLLSEDNVVKICDFGLAKDCYKYDNYQKTSSGPVPVKWMALESLTHKLYTSKSDVWSFGVLLWEMFTLGGNPYPALEIDETFIGRLTDGYRMDKPTRCPEEVYQCMLKCWEKDPDDRPNFSELAECFGDLLQDRVKEHYLELSDHYGKANDAASLGYLDMKGKDSVYLDMNQEKSREECLENDYANAPTFKKVEETPGHVARIPSTKANHYDVPRPQTSGEEKTREETTPLLSPDTPAFPTDGSSDTVDPVDTDSLHRPSSNGRHKRLNNNAAPGDLISPNSTDRDANLTPPAYSVVMQDGDTHL